MFCDEFVMWCSQTAPDSTRLERKSFWPSTRRLCVGSKDLPSWKWTYLRWSMSRFILDCSSYSKKRGCIAFCHRLRWCDPYWHQFGWHSGFLQWSGQGPQDLPSIHGLKRFTVHKDAQSVLHNIAYICSNTVGEFSCLIWSAFAQRLLVSQFSVLKWGELGVSKVNMDVWDWGIAEPLLHRHGVSVSSTSSKPSWQATRAPCDQFIDQFTMTLIPGSMSWPQMPDPFGPF